jgi:hypothetical protein
MTTVALQTTSLFLFGGDAPWSAESWTASDDRVRGGKSQSYLDCPPGADRAVFHGDLDIKTLGGAGFASQRTVDPHSWDLSAYDGLLLRLGRVDDKKYTLTLKDSVLPTLPDGREQSSISWEYDFAANSTEAFVPWGDFKPTYRGRPKPDAEPLDLQNVKRISFMCRSFFGEQEGSFCLEIEYIAAAKANSPSQDRPRPSSSASGSSEFPTKPGTKSKKSSWLGWACGLCG